MLEPMRTTLTILSLIFPLALAGCCTCDPDDAASSLAGGGATDCGLASSADVREPVLACAEAELAAGRPFTAGWSRRGRDTVVRTYLASDGQDTWILGYDGGLSGQCPNLVASRCTAAPARSTNGLDGEVLDCPSDPASAITLCRR